MIISNGVFGDQHVTYLSDIAYWWLIHRLPSSHEVYTIGDIHHGKGYLCVNQTGAICHDTGNNHHSHSAPIRDSPVPTPIIVFFQPHPIVTGAGVTRHTRTFLFRTRPVRELRCSGVHFAILVRVSTMVLLLKSPITLTPLGSREGLLSPRKNKPSVVPADRRRQW